MTIRVWTLVCAKGKIHADLSGPYVCDDEHEAADQLVSLDSTKPLAPCGPHRIVTLRGEVSLARRRA